MSIRYKLLLSFLVIASLFAMGLLVRFFQIHGTLKEIDEVGDVSGPSRAAAALALLDRLPPGRGDPRQCAHLLALDLVFSMQLRLGRAVALHGALLAEGDPKKLVRKALDEEIFDG